MAGALTCPAGATADRAAGGGGCCCFGVCGGDCVALLRPLGGAPCQAERSAAAMGGCGTGTACAAAAVACMACIATACASASWMDSLL